MSRRRFLAGAAGLTVSASSLGRSLAASAAPTRTAPLPRPDRSRLDHIVVVMMENRSFDHLLGWLPGADGRQAGLSYTDASGVAHTTFPLAPDFQGCSYLDPDHSYEGARIQFNNGACDGFLRSKSDVFAIGYYRQRDLAFLGRAAPQWTVCNRYFAAILGPTFPNRLYVHAAATDRTFNSLDESALPTIWDRLAEKGVSAAYYYGSLPFLILWKDKYSSLYRSHNQFFADCTANRLPSVAYVDPVLTQGHEGTAADDHPHSDIRAGEYFLNRVYHAVTTSRAWPRTLLVIVFDEWGGFFEHVPPPVGPDADPAHAQRGFRVPCLLISPFARRRYIAHGLYDHTSILKLIEWRWGLAPLSARDAAAKNLADALDFAHPRLATSRYKVARLVAGPDCPPPGL
jgi:phospholipase C